MKLRAVLFDLDNTLIFFKETTFFEKYSKKLYTYFSDIMSVQEFIQRMLHSTQMITQNNGNQTNLDFFMESFADGAIKDKNELLQRFTTFYETEFEQFRSLMEPLDVARDRKLEKICQN